MKLQNRFKKSFPLLIQSQNENVGPDCIVKKNTTAINTLYNTIGNAKDKAPL